MIPVKLKLTNFTSYGSPTPDLDFTKFHLAAISGENGAGKSSLLDAITWCVWGTSRLGDNADQLIHLGQTEMMVEFSFELDGHIYTIKRARVLKSGGSTVLELTSQSHNLTEGTIKSTQQKIIDTLHLNFETFVNSAFIRQGHADEFTTKGASDRKRILADILGLSHYEVLEEKAKDRAREIQTKLQLLEYQLIEIEAELSQKEEKEKELTSAQSEAKEAEEKLREIEGLIKTISLEKEELQSKVKSRQEARERIQKAVDELEDLKIKISEAKLSQQKYQQILEQKQSIEESYAKLQKLREEEKSLNIKRSELIKVKDELVSIQQVIQVREEKRSQAIASVRINIERLETQNKQLQKEVDHLKDHKNSCPTCGQTIDADKNKEIIDKNSALIENNSVGIKDCLETIEKYKSAVFEQAVEAQIRLKQIQALEEETKNYKEIFSSVEELSKYESLYAKLAEGTTAVKTQQTTVDELNNVLKIRQEQIDKENLEVAELTKYESDLEEVKKRLEGEEIIKHELSQKLLSSKGRVGAAQTLVEKAVQLEKFQKEKGEDKRKYSAEKEAFEQLALAFGKKGIQAMIIETAIPEIEDETNRLLDKLSDGRMKVHFETQRETKTLRPSGSGQAKEHGVVETLDIIISDEMGERPYEAYSGGEQFRVNFAIRLALSKLLTHRAGAKLQFLVIDEGFGTQDAQGRSRIVEALDAIKNDFEKILVITHLEELKEEFPVRVEVSKGAAGSTFEVVGV